MKKVIGILGGTLFLSLSLSATFIADTTDVDMTIITTCEDLAWDVANYVYEKTGDGFEAGAAFEIVMANCVEQ